jgi:AraC-like DNA-binding protein
LLTNPPALEVGNGLVEQVIMSEQAVKDTIFIRKLTEIILANLGDESFGVMELAREAGISNYSLTRRLNSITNTSVKQFIREVRLKKALEMLQNEYLTISEVAYKVGFGCPAYFNTCFHDFFGFSPGTVKRGDLSDKKEIKTVQPFPRQQQKKRLWQVFLFGSSVIFIIVASWYLGYILFFRNTATDKTLLPINPKKSVAVLPFKNLSDTSTNHYFIDGVMDDLLDNLAEAYYVTGGYYSNTGNTRKAMEEYVKAININVIDRDAHCALAAVYAYRGDKEKAYENLKIFCQQKIIVSWMLSLMKTYPIFDSIRNEPEFLKILNDAEAKYNKEHEKLRKWLEEQGML